MIANTVRSHTHAHTTLQGGGGGLYTSHDLTFATLIRVADISTRTYSNGSVGLFTSELLKSKHSDK